MKKISNYPCKTRNIYKTSGKSCSKLGAEIKYNKSLESDHIEKDYIEATKRLTLQLNSNPTPEAESFHKKWFAMAKEQKNKLKLGEITANDFIIWINSTSRKSKKKTLKE